MRRLCWSKNVKTLMAAVLFWASTTLAAESGFKALPDWSRVEKLFLTTSGAQPVAILSQGDVLPFFEQLKKMGWNVRDRAAIIDAMLPDGDPLVSELRSTQGKALSAQIQSLPGVYDKLDRLARLPNGTQTLHDLTRAKDAFKLLEFLTSAKGAAQLSTMLPKNAKDDFNLPTGHLYTPEQFLTRVKKSHEEAAGKLSQFKPNAKKR